MNRRQFSFVLLSPLLLGARLETSAQTPQATPGPFTHIRQTQPDADPENPSAYIGALLGEPDAPTRLIVYSDSQCQYCQGFYLELLPSLVADFIEPGDVVLEYREHPILGRGGLSSPINTSSIEAQALLLAGEQDAYFPMLDAIMHRAEVYSDDAVTTMAEIAGNIGIDAGAIRAGIEELRYVPVLYDAVINGRIRGVTATPTFNIGPADDRAAVLDSDLITLGRDGYEGLRKTIDEALTGAG